MHGNDIIFSDGVYLKHLAAIDGYVFTHREIDVIACLVNARGTSKIASLLTIAPSTVKTHIQNVMTKIGCNSREGIIDFVERSRKLSLIREYYAALVIHKAFEKTLRDVAKLYRASIQAHQSFLEIPPLKVYGKNKSYKDSILKHLKTNLNQVYLHVDVREEENNGPLIKGKREEDAEFFILIKQLQPGKLTSHLNLNTSTANFIDISKCNTYYSAVCAILKKLLPQLKLEGLFANFIESHEDLEKIPHIRTPQKETLGPSVPILLTKVISLVKERKGSILSTAIIVTFISVNLCFFKVNKDCLILGSAPSIRSHLIIPSNDALLQRPEEIAQINEKLSSKDGIQVMALIGPGGSGKTTLARQYAHQKEASLIWEINAETQETLKTSFEGLSKALAITTEDKKFLKRLEEINFPKERETKLVEFIKEHLKLYPDWLLIYDNVEKFTDIRNYFPYDPSKWGLGKVILTTRDTTLQNNSLINAVLCVGPLNQKQKYLLFSKIMSLGSSKPPPFTEEVKRFLEEIPPFPLDISLAAYYLKSTDTPYRHYLKSIDQHNKDFVKLQSTLLKEFGDYTNTRYGIVTLSLQHLIETNQEFIPLLLLTSLLDSQDIPRELLDSYKGKDLIDNLIYHLKSYSLITSQPAAFLSQKQSFSIHRSTQAIILTYLTEKLKLKENFDLMRTTAYALEAYMNRAIEDEDLQKMRSLMVHTKSFLGYKTFLPKDTRTIIEAKLGCLYYYTHHHEIARKMLETTTRKLLHQPHPHNYRRAAQAFSYLGSSYKEIGELEKGKRCLIKSRELYTKYDTTNYLGLIRALTSLADTYKNSGNHKAARDLLEYSLALAHKNLGPHHIELARSLLYLGIVCRDMGDYQKAVDFLKNSLFLFSTCFPENHSNIVRSLKYLGNTYRSLGRYEEAKKLLKQSLVMCDKYLPDNQIALGRTLVHLATIYKNLGDYKTSLDLLTKSLNIHKQVFGLGNVRTHWVVVSIANIYREYGNNQQAASLIDQSLPIYIKAYGPDNLKTSWVALQRAYVYEESGNFAKAKELLEKALEVHKKHFPDTHIKIAVIFLHLGNVYRGLGQYEKAMDALKKSLQIYEKHYGRDHVETAKTLESIGRVLMCENKYDEATSKLTEALQNFQAKNHPAMFLVLEDLSTLHFKKAETAKDPRKLKIQALGELKKALSIAHFSLPKNSATLKRLQALVHSTQGYTSRRSYE
jgi:tetratricopeptide (TPR) repeat protein/DNA-binding CsgD family transcriptional regulator